MTSSQSSKRPASGGRATSSSGRSKGKRAARRASGRALARAGTYGSSGGGLGPILGWSLVFGVIAVAVVGAALVLSQPSGDTNALKSPAVLTPASIPSNGRTLGVTNAPVTIDLYGDFRCVGCYQFTFGGTEQAVVDNYVATGKARIVWHDRLVIDDGQGNTASRDAANAARCAADQNKFWVMHDWLYANQDPYENASAFTKARLADIGRAAGLNMTLFQPCLDNGTHNAAIAAENASAAANSINKTPTVLVNNAPVTTGTYENIKAAIDAALAS